VDIDGFLDSKADKERHANRQGFTFRKEGHTKIIEYDLSSKSKAYNEALNLRRPNVLASDALSTSHHEKASVDVLDTGDDEGYTNSEDLDDDDAMDIGPDQALDDSGDEIDADSSAEQPHASKPRAINGKEKTARGRNERLVTSTECRAHLRRLFRNETTLCSLLYGRHGPFASALANKETGFVSTIADFFFMDVVPVTPTRFRPPAKMGDITFEHHQNQLLSSILATTYRLRDLNGDLSNASKKDSTNPETSDTYTEEQRQLLLRQLIGALVQLQVDVNSFMDSTKNPTPTYQGKLPPQGVKQLLEKKDGLFRKNMMVSRFSSHHPDWMTNQFVTTLRENASIMQLVP
jgi:DNA-directed RNA polymerase I subunit RPA1